MTTEIQPPATVPLDSVGYLVARAAAVERRVRWLVAERRAEDALPDDPFRGLYVTDEAVDRMLDGPRSTPAVVVPDELSELEAQAQLAEQSGVDIRLRRLARAASLLPLDVELLIIALLPDLDARFERLYGYLNDDVTRRRATVGLALELTGASGLAAGPRTRLTPSRPLVRHGLVLVEEPDRPVLTRGLRVADRVTAYLLGDDAPDPALAGVVVDVAGYPSAVSARLAEGLQAGVRFVYLQERVAGSGAATAVAALTERGLGTITLDLTRFAEPAEPAATTRLAAREALLRGAGLVAGPVERIAERDPTLVRQLAEAEVPLLLVGTSTWNPEWSSRNPLIAEAPAPSGAARAELWSRELSAIAAEIAGDVDIAALAAPLVLGPGQVRRAVQSAQTLARLRDGRITPDDLRQGVRAQNAAGLERLARRIEPEVSWPDLVLAPPVRRALTELAARARHRDRVLSEWGMRRGGGRGLGITALFAGDSGTGKTMSAEVIAADLGLDLYTVNLATVVDKYVGETEKNLERIFAEADGVNAVLFFDEAEAIFGKRSEVRDAHDRYANIESAYLLQRLETFGGLAVLATNLRANVDDAFVRRLDAIVDFPAPTPVLRRLLWVRCLAAPLPVADDVDLDFLADAFELSGGNIRSAATTAAYLAAAEGVAVCMGHVINAVEQEYRKLGRLVLEREFGRYFADL